MRLLLLAALCACAGPPPVARLSTPPADVPARPSAGCKSSAPVAQGDRTLSSGGRTRRFRLKVPASALGHPAPMVLNLHGLVETAELQQYYSRMDEAGAARGVISVYPQGAMNSWNAGECCGRAMDEKLDDVRFLRMLVRELESELCVDKARVYATGMSNGAIMSYRLACEASDVFAAIAPVDGVEAVPQCNPRRPVPVLAFNGTSDLLVRWNGGFGLESPATTLGKWRERNRCSKEIATSFEQGDARCEAARGCAADVILCRIEGGGHTWPGAMMMPFLGHTSSDIDATATMLDFFLAHPMGSALGGFRDLQASGASGRQEPAQ
jgi:polyhydroxybutyrate depolymerase